jgi:hypothetical protein
VSDFSTVATIAGSLLGGGGLAATYGYLKDRRTAPTDEEVRADASVVLMAKAGDGLGQTIALMQKQMDDMQKRHALEIEEQAKRHSAERMEWYADRADLRQQVADLRSQVDALLRLNQPNPTHQGENP